MAACSDSTYQSYFCSQNCDGNVLPDVTYNEGMRKWFCCDMQHTGLPLHPDCGKPIDESFGGAGPDVLLGRYSAASALSIPSMSSQSVSTSAASLATTTTSTSTSAVTGKTPINTTPTNSTSPQGTEGGGISMSAKIGLGVGIPLGVISIAALIIYLLRRRRRRRKRSGTQIEGSKAVAMGKRIITNESDFSSNSKGPFMPQMPLVSGLYRYDVMLARLGTLILDTCMTQHRIVYL